MCVGRAGKYRLVGMSFYINLCRVSGRRVLCYWFKSTDCVGRAGNTSTSRIPFGDDMPVLLSCIQDSIQGGQTDKLLCPSWHMGWQCRLNPHALIVAWWVVIPGHAVTRSLPGCLVRVVYDLNLWGVNLPRGVKTEGTACQKNPYDVSNQGLRGVTADTQTVLNHPKPSKTSDTEEFDRFWAV